VDFESAKDKSYEKYAKWERNKAQILTTSSLFLIILDISMSTRPMGFRIASEIGAIRYRYEAYSG